MKLAALALDYDGTIAQNDHVEPVVRDAIAQVRARGLVVLLVTGRVLNDLRRLLGDLCMVDAVVAENGAVLCFPDSGRSSVLGQPPPELFLSELARRGVQVLKGECIVEADASAAPVILQTIRELELPLVLLFNRGRVMVLPQAISKATGLRHALSALRMSVHNTLAIGDAENDHQLLDVCEVGVAVEWGSEALKASADEIVSGPRPAAIADYILRVAGQTRLSAPQMGRRRLLVGYSANGEPVKVAVRGRSVLVAGEPGTGKSWVTGLLCEQLILQGYSLCVLDPEGDYRSLETLPGVIVLGGEDPAPHSRELLRTLRHPDVSVVLDLSKMPHAEKVEYLHSVLPVLAEFRRRTGLPHRIVLDEAHYFLRGPDPSALLDLELAGYTLVTYRVSQLNPAAINSADSIVIVTRESDPDEVCALLERCAPESRDRCKGLLEGLALGEAVVLPGAAEFGGELRRFRLAPRLTLHVRHRAKYLDMPVAEAEAFVLDGSGGDALRIRTLKDLMSVLETSPSSRLEPYLRRSDLSKWIRDVFRDHALAIDVHRLEESYQLGQAPAVNEALVRVIRERYELMVEAPPTAGARSSPR